jgi:Cu-Zn family superoxide dismutase
LGCEGQGPNDDQQQLGGASPDAGALSEAPPATRDAAEQDQAPPATPPRTAAPAPGGADPSANAPDTGRAPEALDSARAESADPERGRARAMLSPTEGSSAHGSVEFTPAPDGGLDIEVMVSGLEPGTHGFHIHEYGDCSAPDASSAGDHFAPSGDRHGAPKDPPSTRHAGDLGNITADNDGVATKQMQDGELDLNGQLGVVGRAVIVHQNADDLETQPSGEAGDPIACGIVEMVETTRIERADRA